MACTSSAQFTGLVANVSSPHCVNARRTSSSALAVVPMIGHVMCINHKRDSTSTDNATATAAASSSATEQQLATYDHHVANLLHAYLSQPCHQRILAQLREQFTSPILDPIRAAYSRASNINKKK